MIIVLPLIYHRCSVIPYLCRASFKLPRRAPLMAQIKGSAFTDFSIRFSQCLKTLMNITTNATIQKKKQKKKLSQQEKFD